MTAIIHDGLKIYRLFTSVINSLTSNGDKRGVSIVYIQTSDFADQWLIYSPGLAAILRRLIPRPIKYDVNFANYLRNLNISSRDIPDFELSLYITQTLWLLKGGEIVGFYEYISDKLKLKTPIIPFLRNIPDIRIKIKEGEKEPTVPEYYDLEKIGEIIEMKINAPKDMLQPTNKTIETIKNSDFVLLFQLSPLTLHFLSKISGLKKMIESYKGHIGYILPHELSLGDRKILEKYYEGDIVNLINSLEGVIDIVIFDKNYYKLVTQLQDVDMTLYPISFENGKSTDYKKSVEEIIKIIESEH